MLLNNKGNENNPIIQLGRLFKKLREKSGKTIREVAERIDLGHGNDNTGIGINKRVGMINDFEDGRMYTLTAAQWVNIAELFNIPMTDLIEEKGWPVPSLECAAFVIKKLHEKYN
ncbi:MAG: helix-turn-helix domain-containing protein [Defluviitaleaceae bacterium]|nr:helix-turn-helix domain-containing protein [Defluviitaleaceae bacterium]